MKIIKVIGITSMSAMFLFLYGCEKKEIETDDDVTTIKEVIDEENKKTDKENNREANLEEVEKGKPQKEIEKKEEVEPYVVENLTLRTTEREGIGELYVYTGTIRNQTEGIIDLKSVQGGLQDYKLDFIKVYGEVNINQRILDKGEKAYFYSEIPKEYDISEYAPEIYVQQESGIKNNGEANLKDLNYQRTDTGALITGKINTTAAVGQTVYISLAILEENTDKVIYVTETYITGSGEEEQNFAYELPLVQDVKDEVGEVYVVAKGSYALMQPQESADTNQEEVVDVEATVQ